jgi:hypothetical protein
VVTNADLDVFDPCGTQVDDGSPQALGRTVSVGMSADRSGTYTVQWQVISEDGHNVSGDWTFVSSGGAACPGSDPQPRRGGGDGGDPSADRETSQDGEIAGNSEGATETSGSGSGPADDPQRSDRSRTSQQPGTSDAKGGAHRHDQGPRGRQPGGGSAAPGDASPGTSTGDLPLDWLLISFGIAALVGAAGGSLYTNIVNPRR